MSNIRYYAPTGTTEITLGNGTKLAVNSSGYVTADASFAPELQRAGFTAGTEDSVQAVTGPNGEVSLQAGSISLFIGDASTDTVTIDRSATGGNTVASTTSIVEIVNGKTWTRTASYNGRGELLSIGAATIT